LLLLEIPGSTASTAGPSTNAGGIASIVAVPLVGFVSDRYGYFPLLVSVGLLPLLGTVLISGCFV
jgi:MFS family permease